MATQNCNCGGNNLDNFYSLFVCDHANCAECHWTNNKCYNGCYSDTSLDSNCNSKHLNYYDISMQNVISSKIKAFGYCDNHQALGIQFADGTKRLYLNIDKQIYEDLVALNKDTLLTYLEQNIDDKQYVEIP